MADPISEDELARQFAPRIRLYGLRHLRSEAAADDLVQTVIVVVLEALRAGKVREPDRLASFVLGTARLTAQGWRRGEARRADLVERFGDDAATVAPPDGAGLDVARLGRCLEALPARERTIVALGFYDDHGADEIGAALGMTAGNVRVARHRAVARLAGCMGAA